IRSWWTLTKRYITFGLGETQRTRGTIHGHSSKGSERNPRRGARALDDSGTATGDSGGGGGGLPRARLCRFDSGRSGRAGGRLEGDRLRAVRQQGRFVRLGRGTVRR